MRLTFGSLAMALALATAPVSAMAATCGGDYGAWLAQAKQEAAGRGIGARGLAALDGMTPDPAVIRKDRGQGVFRQTFEQFGPHRVAPLLNAGANKLRAMGSFFASLESQTGAWAGEIGQTQFMPSSYLKFGGGRDLIHSSQNALSATASYLRGYGWSKGAGWEPGQPNFAVIKEWNKSDVYARTIAYFATRLSQMVH